MKKRIVIFVVLVLSLFIVANSYAAERDSFGMKVKKFWRGFFKAPATATEETVNVVTDTGKKGTKVVTDEVRRVGDVTSGDVKQAKDLVVEPVKGVAETGKIAIEGTVNVPVKTMDECIK
ncbi:MAG: hypothetical protein JW800_00285 [Candidatus Omnitrophica bacterium]|nr:hypothetical protein [Candidatus Omnitrophota bacterium]